MNEITLKGLYQGNDPKGMIIGGKLFTPKNVATTSVVEPVFLNLQKAETNGWFKILEHNYKAFLIANGRIEVETTRPRVTIIEGDTPEGNTLEEDTPEGNTLEEETPEGNTLEEDTPEGDTLEEDTPEGDTPKGDTLEEGTPEGEVPGVEMITDFNAFAEMSNRNQNTAIRENKVSEEILRYVADNADLFKPTTVELAKDAIK